MPEKPLLDKFDGPGILMPNQREFLLDPDEHYSDSNDPAKAKRELRGRIRSRVKNAMRDFELLADPEYFQWRDRQQIFAAKGDSEGNRMIPPDNDPEMASAVSDAIEFLFLGLVRRSENWEPLEEGGGHHSPEFEEQLEEGLRRAYAKHQLQLESADLQIASSWDYEHSPEFIEVLQQLEELDEDEFEELAGVLEEYREQDVRD